MEKILFISSRPIYPVIGGDQIRSVQQLEFLKEKYIVDVFYFTNADINTIDLNQYEGIGRVFIFRISKIMSIIHTLKFIFNKLPLQVNYYYNKIAEKKIAGIIQDYNYVFCNNIRTAEYVRNYSGIIKYLDFVDAISMNYNKAWKKTHGIRKIIYKIDAKRCLKYERECLSLFDSCAIISDIDKKYITT